jgi:hypothetical protein
LIEGIVFDTLVQDFSAEGPAGIPVPANLKSSSVPGALSTPSGTIEGEKSM